MPPHKSGHFDWSQGVHCKSWTGLTVHWTVDWTMDWTLDWTVHWTGLWTGLWTVLNFALKVSRSVILQMSLRLGPTVASLIDGALCRPGLLRGGYIIITT